MSYYSDALDIVQQYGLVYNKVDGQIYRYSKKKGIYILVNENMLQRIVSRYICENYAEDDWTPKYMNSVIKALGVASKDIKLEKDDDRYIVFKNGVYDIETKELIPHNKKYKATYRIEYDYISSKCLTPIFDKYCYDVSLGDSEMMDTLLEIIGYCLTDSMKAEKLIVCYGFGANGKSVYLNMLECILKNCTYLNVTDINKRRFSLASMVDSKLNIIHELDNGVTLDDCFDANMKSIISFDKIRVEAKSLPVYEYAFRTKLIAATNSFPQIENVPKYAVLRRYLVLPFNAVFTDDNCDKNILEKIKSEIPAIISKSLAKYDILVSNGFKFTYEKKSERILKDEIEAQFPLISFVRENIESAPGSKMHYSDLKNNFDAWKKMKKLRVNYSDRVFASELKKALEFNRINYSLDKSNGSRGLSGIKCI